jgi:hypothetical protein
MQIFAGNSPMRNVFSPQMCIGQRDIADIQIDVSSRDDIPVILLGLQHIFTTKPLRDAVFKILEEVAPTKMDNDVAKIISINKGRPGMDQWSILVLGSLRVGLNADYDRILELANQHNTLREMLGLSGLNSLVGRNKSISENKHFRHTFARIAGNATTRYAWVVLFRPTFD